MESWKMKDKGQRKRQARFRHIGLTRLTYARERIGRSPYVFRVNRFRHTTNGGGR